ncbi:YggU family protein [Corallincola holothuriorum]|uniref:UPF0235 protein DU002_14385 n=1 Tax=Corallincola holothuriorum TaxID=2282215 RepID=A0A368N4Z5_9GAMM|nr:DUF167 family protein YggU [Corallincola holothuriorum]RCU45647.1 YggU family protein [Corallincola holothuriorum]
MQAVTRTTESLELRLYVQPKASRDNWQGIHGDEIKLAITAPPVDGKANSHLIKFLAKQFRVAKNQVLLLKGATGRHKLLRILQPQQIPPQIAALLTNEIN